MATARADTRRPGPRDGLTTRIVAAARRPVAGQSAAVFRISFGLLVAYGSLRFLVRGWVDSLYLDPEHHLTYPGFEWVRPLPAPWMHAHLVVLAVLGLCIAVGYRHRLSAAMFVVGFTYTELIDATLYLNHYWYVTLAGLLLVLLPVQHCWSLDARAGRVRPSPTVPIGVVWALRAQLGVVYVFAGLAKLNPDWLFRAQPMRLWLADRADLPIIGSLLDEPAVAFLASWSGALFDCTIVAWLLWPRTRRWAYAAVVGFHLTTGALFQIGVFPWVMICGTLVFFEPDWPSRIVGRTGPSPASRPLTGPGPFLRGPALAGLAVLALIEIALPLRHYAYPGNVRWNEEGYYLSWRVMLTEKAGHLEFEVTDPTTGRSWMVGPGLVLTDWQTQQAAVRPDLIHATAHLVADHYADEFPDLEVRARAWVSMNGGPAQPMVDPTVDLAARSRNLAPSDWILAPA